MRNQKKGKVFLIGAGPGDPGLLTLRGAEALEGAQVVVYDRLVSPALLDFARNAEKIFVGKKGGDPFTPQDQINKILLRAVRNGKKVARLKGGDPFIFGRGGEEANFLATHRIPFEVIPGISAGTGAPAYAGIPLTDRRFSSEVLFVTAHENPAKNEFEIDWEKIASMKGTLVLFMGVQNLQETVKILIRYGKSKNTPVAVIERGTYSNQRVITGNLGNILKKASHEEIESPALTVIGNVVRLRSKLDWFSAKQRGPLLGKNVLVTRGRSQAKELVRRLNGAGAKVIEFPTIEILPPADYHQMDREIARIDQYDWVIFTSANGVHHFFERMRSLGKDARIFSKAKIAVIGDATAQALLGRGIRADLIPKRFTSEELFKALKTKDEIRDQSFLLARADIAPPDLRKALEKEGAQVVEIVAYRTKKPSTGGAALCLRSDESLRGTASLCGRPVQGDHAGLSLYTLIKKNKIDYITFTSSSTVRNFFSLIPPALHKNLRSRFVSIGPVTSQTLREYGFNPQREAKIHTIEGLVDTLCNGDRTR